VRSSSRATWATVFPDPRTRRTASALNSGVNRRRLRFVIFGLMDTSIMTGEGWEMSTKTGQAYGLEALASAASAAIDEYRLPSSADRREFHRVHALVGDTAEKAVALVELAESLKKAFMPHGRAADGDQ